jgi:hypothetical protein
MRRIIQLISIFLLFAGWAVAQHDNGSDSDRNTASSKATVVGCLDGAAGNYTLIAPSGASYQLTGNTKGLKGHVREIVRVTGVMTPVVHVPGSISEGTQSQPTLSVDSFKRVSAVCSDTNNIR